MIVLIQSISAADGRSNRAGPFLTSTVPLVIAWPPPAHPGVVLYSICEVCTGNPLLMATVSSTVICLCSFYNSVWLISNDIIVGTAFGAFLCENNNALAGVLSYAVEV
jgi:hypothetical protein